MVIKPRARSSSPSSLPVSTASDEDAIGPEIDTAPGDSPQSPVRPSSFRLSSPLRYRQRNGEAQSSSWVVYILLSLLACVSFAVWTSLMISWQCKGSVSLSQEPTKHPLPVLEGSLRAQEKMQASTSKEAVVYDEVVYDVLIIGAGWAGIAAAETLRMHGIKNFQIIEGRDYVGGRSRTIYPFADAPYLPVELGSAWTYRDTEPHYVMKDQELPRGRIHYDDISTFGLFQAEGGALNETSFTEYQDLWQAFCKFTAEYKKYLEKQDSVQEKSSAHILESFFKKFNRDAFDPVEARRFLETMTHAQIEVKYGAPLEEVSSRKAVSSIGECIFCDVGYYTAVDRGGFDKILRPLVNPLRKHFVLKQTVTQIEYSDDQPHAFVTHVDRRGTKHRRRAKTVLSTVPLGVLKRGSIHFMPPLPQAKKDAVDVVGFGLLNKCILYWAADQSTWWPEGKETLSIITDEPGNFTVIFNDKEIGNDGHNVLSAYAGGNHAKKAEDWSNQEIVNKVMTHLRHMFGKDVPEPTDYSISRWGQDEFAYGSYSFTSVGREGLVRSARRELGTRTGSRLFWAGEATDGEWYGTTVGAFKSGQKAAEDILLTLRRGLSTPVDVQAPVIKER